MRVNLITPPALEPITLAEAKLHLRVNSGSFSESIDEMPSFHPASYAVADDWTTNYGEAVEVLGYTAVVNFQAGTNLTTGTVDMRIQEADVLGTWTAWGTDFTQVTAEGILIGAALAIGTTITAVANGAFTYYIAGVNYSKAANLVGTAPGNDVIPQGKYGAVALDIGADGTIDVIEAANNAVGYNTAALAIAGIAAVLANHVRMGTVTAMKSDGAFTFGNTALNAANSTVAYTSAVAGAMVPDNASYEKAYTGTKRYIRTVAKVLRAACIFNTSIIRLTSTTYEDDLLNALITTAREHTEDITRRALLTQTWEYYLDEFPKDNFIKLPFGNLQTVNSFTYKKSDWTVGAEITLVEDVDYIVETNGDQCGRIVLPFSGSWPLETLFPSNPIIIEFVCGWTTTALIPYKIKAAIKRICSKLYESRGEDILGQTVHEDKTVNDLLVNARLWDEF